VCPEERVQLNDFPFEGIRPVVEKGNCLACNACLEVCPALRSDFTPLEQSGCGVDSDFINEWGPIAAMWEGHATDPEVRWKGSSGGALTAISAYCLEVLGMRGVLHIAQDPDDPLRNRTRLSRTRRQLLAATGSRYAPASVANGLKLVEDADGPCVIIGKPSEISAVRNARRMRPALDAKVGVTLSFFCAESPCSQGTVALLKKLQVDPAAVSSLKYRGEGWPGHFAPVRSGETVPCHRITYQESWTFLQAHRPWSVQLWPDGNGEQADISCGDPWYKKPDGINPGFSLVVARTAKGQEIIEGAMAAGYLTLTPAEHWKLEQSQSGLLAKKGSVYGRRLAMKLRGLPVTQLSGLNLRHCWSLLSWKAKALAFFGTLRRISSRKLNLPLQLDPKGAVPVGRPWTEPTETVTTNVPHSSVSR
jgi:coenzyme F420 hydrogenase subunit beta